MTCNYFVFLTFQLSFSSFEIFQNWLILLGDITCMRLLYSHDCKECVALKGVIDGGHGGTIDTVSSRWVQGGSVIDVFALGSILPALLSDCQTGSGSAAHCNMDPSVLRFNHCNDAYQHKWYYLCQRWCQREYEQQLPELRKVFVCVNKVKLNVMICADASVNHTRTSHCNMCVKRRGKWRDE